MPFKWEVEFDTTTNRWGEQVPRVLPSGHYRFTLGLGAEDGVTLMMEIHGFRVNKNFTTILPPLSSAPNGRMFHIIDLSPEGMKVLLDRLKVKSQGVVEPPAA